MTHFVSKTGVWDVEIGTLQTPVLTVENIPSGSVLKVTCQFFARTLSDHHDDGFRYAIAVSDDGLPLSPTQGIVQGSDSWQLYTHVAFYEVVSFGVSEKLDFALELSRGDLNGKGAMMNFLLTCEMLASE